MPEETMPAAEAEGVDAPESASYELAFHVLPTVAEGEVATVFQTVKDIITKHGGALGLEEAPARFDLAYEIERYLEGRNRKFGSAYFGWVRFTADPATLEAMAEDIDGVKELLRYLFVRLTKAEEENPFFFHEALAEQKSETIDLDEEVVVVEEASETVVAAAPESAETEDDAKEDGEESKDKV